MNIEDVKQIPIADYLHSLGYSPVKQQGNGLWYKSPLREEHEPSFKVNTDRNLWYDFGAGKGGNIIALAKELYCSDSLPYLLNRIAEQTPHVRPVSFSFPHGDSRAERRLRAWAQYPCGTEQVPCEQAHDCERGQGLPL